jgi:hypothetical protein
MDNVFSSSVEEKNKKTETKQKMIENKTKLELKIVCKKKLNSIKGHLITYGLHTSSAIDGHILFASQEEMGCRPQGEF